MNPIDQVDKLKTCAAPPPLSDDDLFAVLDGEAEPQINAHLKVCAFCSDRLEQLRAFENSLMRTMYRADCLSTDQIADYVMNEPLTVGEKQQLQYHLSRCELCRGEVEQLRAALVVDEPAPSALPTPAREPVKDFLRSLEQVVQVLLPQALPASGQQYKGSSGQPNRVLTFDNGHISVMLSLDKTAEGLRINGTIADYTQTESAWNDGRVVLLSLEENDSASADIDDLGTFIFTAVKAGRFDLTIYGAEDKVLQVRDILLQL